ncbi:MAG: hypothetical protein WCQ95_14060 [Bacteroidota bacterium]
MEPIEKTILYTSNDLQLAYTMHFQKAYPVRSRLLLMVGGLSFLVGIFLLVFQFYASGLNYTNWAAWFLLFYGAIIAVLYFYNLSSIGKRMYSKMPDFKKPFHYVFTPDSVQVKSENINATNNWEFYQSAMIHPNVIMVYPNKFRFSLFPKKYFTDQEFETLKQWVRAKIKTKETK